MNQLKISVNKYKIQERYQTEITKPKNKTELKNSIKGFNNRLDQWKKGSVTSKTVWWNSSNEKRKKNRRRENSLRDLWGTIECTNMYIIGTQRKRQRKG